MMKVGLRTLSLSFILVLLCGCGSVSLSSEIGHVVIENKSEPPAVIVNSGSTDKLK